MLEESRAAGFIYLFILICVCKNPACQIGFKNFGCESAENVMGTAAATDTQNSPHTAITIANTTVPSLSNSRLTLGWRKHTQQLTQTQPGG